MSFHTAFTIGAVIVGFVIFVYLKHKCAEVVQELINTREANAKEIERMERDWNRSVLVNTLMIQRHFIDLIKRRQLHTFDQTIINDHVDVIMRRSGIDRSTRNRVIRSNFNNHLFKDIIVNLMLDAKAGKTFDVEYLRHTLHRPPFTDITPDEPLEFLANLLSVINKAFQK